MKAFRSLSELSRREFLARGAVAAGALALPRLGFASEYELSDAAKGALEGSPFVYISPLHPDGSESRCHGEVWYFFDKGDVVIYSDKQTWKARALASGRETARVWVGDLGRGRFKGERFRQGPSFQARGNSSRDAAAFERLLAAFGKKYPDEWGTWEERFRNGWANGSRVLLRYTPIGD